ncbi:hypothetical protein PROPJV5_1265 [Propionibacterium ruminifibrarum]|uniref:Uncharacterized protein n=1 Tax=Propionibacterium ruminifibrarum TaxID=1962131 RepID=A0A375I2H3_9ACTN|nr:hypothetical protein PROPJV5_1265 [Propionibacterium ruminifibrarum]
MASQTTTASLNGAPPIQVGKLGRGRDVEDLSRKPQWSPTYSGGETPRTGRGQFPHGGASMEPHLFRWGNRPATPSPSTSPTGLNGAPPIQVGKRHTRSRCSASPTASMEPHLFRWGNHVLMCNVNEFQKPQWSPTYSGGETFLVLRDHHASHRASMEPHLFRWGNLAWWQQPSMQSTSLNGAPPIQVGKRHSVKEHAAQADASMEPHLFRWGNSSSSLPYGHVIGPQWSPTYSGGETSVNDIRACTLSRPQWSPTYSGGETGDYENAIAGINAPQWSPTYSGGETKPSSNLTGASGTPQWSPTYSGGETSVRFCGG